jgi:hypothetical protein
MSDCHSGVLVKIPVFPDVKLSGLIYRYRRCEGAAISRKIGNCTPKDSVSPGDWNLHISQTACGPTTSGRVICSCTSSYLFKAGVVCSNPARWRMYTVSCVLPRAEAFWLFDLSYTDSYQKCTGFINNDAANMYVRANSAYAVTRTYTEDPVRTGSWNLSIGKFWASLVRIAIWTDGWADIWQRQVER